jgi:hypothetical protein
MGNRNTHLLSLANLYPENWELLENYRLFPGAEEMNVEEIIRGFKPLKK